MIIPVEFAQVNFFFNGPGVPNGAQVTLGVQNPDNDSAVVMAGAIRDAWHARMRGLYGNNVTMWQVLVKKGPNATGEAAVVPATSTGTSANPGDSPNTALLVHKVTGSGGRAGRGRMYIPGVPSSNVDGSGNITSEGMAAFQPACTNFLNDLIGLGYEPQLLHSSTSGPIEEPLTVIAFTVDGRVATQRRRLRK